MNAMRRIVWVALLLVGLHAIAAQPAFGAAGVGRGAEDPPPCTVTSCDAPNPACGTTTYGTDNCGGSCSRTGAACCTVTSCNAPAPTCDRTTSGTDNCGGACYRTGPACCTVTSCNAPAPACDQTTYGTDNCGGSCSRSGAACCTVTSCNAPEPTACGETTYGTNNCGGSCTKTGRACPAYWQPYGFVVPGDSTYGFGSPNPNTRDLLGLAAKGNIVIGDYADRPGTDSDFPGQVVPRITPGAGSITQPYVVDPTDAGLGYRDYSDGKGRPVFNGNYDRHDGGLKLDRHSSPRKFYESSLPDAEFSALVDPKLSRTSYKWGATWAFEGGRWVSRPGWVRDYYSTVTIDGVLFTNHALAGLSKSDYLVINGALVGRDDGLVFGRNLTINHDSRLIGNKATDIVLPFSIKRPKLIRMEVAK